MTTKSNVTMSEMITKNHALVAEFGDSLDRLLDGIENFMANSRPTLGGERFLTDREVSARLKVSRRTLQDYRNNGVVSYYQLGGKILYKESDIESMLAANYAYYQLGGKILYKESDIERMLAANYREAFR